MRRVGKALGFVSNHKGIISRDPAGEREWKIASIIYNRENTYARSLGSEPELTMNKYEQEYIFTVQLCQGIQSVYFNGFD